MSTVNVYGVGIIVKLKSGGPDMTIKSVENDIRGNWRNSYDCQWFAGKKLERGSFHHDSLETVGKE